MPPDKCHGCPRTDKDVWCPGQIAPVVCSRKDTVYKEFLENILENYTEPTIFSNDVFVTPQNVPQIVSLDSDTYKIRLDICKVCEYFIAESERCELCGCSLGSKLRDETQHCPIEKW